MLIARHLVAGAFGVALLSGCATSSPSPKAPWPEFLPVDVILSGDRVDVLKTKAEIRSMEVRIRDLRRRARLLRGPIETIQERLAQQ